MPRYFEQKTSFGSGQVSPDLIGRSGIKAHNEGMLELKNVYIKPSGAIQRRHGTAFVSSTSSHARLVSFSLGTIRGIIAITMDGFSIREDTGLTVDYDMAYLDEEIVNELSISYNDNRIYFCGQTNPVSYFEFNPMYTDPKDVKKRWAFKELSFDKRGHRTLEPTKKAPKGAKVTFIDSGNIDTQTKLPIYKITSSEPFFTEDHTDSNTFFYYKDQFNFQIYEYINPYNAFGLLEGDLKGKTELADDEWEYSAFSYAYGYPFALGFHQGRLVLAGNFQSPSTLWFSKSGNFSSFDYGTGLDDEAIDVSITDGQMNLVKSLISSKNLLVFTTNGVWSINGSPITPSNTSYNLLTSIPTYSNVKPLQVEDSFIYVGSEATIYQLTPSLDGLYNATNLSYVCGNIIKNPRDMCFDSKHSLLQVVNEDGSLAVMSYYKDSQTIAWSTWETQGKYYSLTRVNDDIYYSIIRSRANIEIAKERLLVDGWCTPYGDSDHNPEVQLYIKRFLGDCRKKKIIVYETDEDFNTLNSLNIDNFSFNDQLNGLDYKGKYFGLSYDTSIKPLPISGEAVGASVQGGRLRVVSVTFRLQNSSILTIERENSKLYDVPLNYLDKNPLTKNTEYSGDVKVSMLGWKKGSYTPAWHIHITKPTNFTLISVSTNIMASL